MIESVHLSSSAWSLSCHMRRPKSPSCVCIKQLV